MEAEVVQIFCRQHSRRKQNRNGKQYLYVSLCPQSILPIAVTSAFTLTPLLGWMKLPGKHEIRPNRTETANEEFLLHTILQWNKDSGNRDMGTALLRYVG